MIRSLLIAAAVIATALMAADSKIQMSACRQPVVTEISTAPLRPRSPGPLTIASLNMAEETEDVGRTLPRAILIAILVSAFLYAAVSLVAIAAIPPDALAEAPAPLAAVRGGRTIRARSDNGDVRRRATVSHRLAGLLPPCHAADLPAAGF